jgi:hypothetical protein
LRKKYIFVYTQNPKFFFRVNKRLKSLKIAYKVLNSGNNIPQYPSIILTTKIEAKKLSLFCNKKTIILPYEENDDFEKYIFRFFKVYKVGEESCYNLAFSIDPGKKFGLIAFINGYYFYSKTFFEKESLIEDILKAVEYLKEINSFCPDLTLKIGRGVLRITLDLIEKIFENIKEENLVMFLIDEGKSSKIKLHKSINHLSKHEASALILALRDGIKVNHMNYVKIISQIKSNKIAKNAFFWLINPQTHFS